MWMGLPLQAGWRFAPSPNTLFPFCGLSCFLLFCFRHCLSQVPCTHCTSPTPSSHIIRSTAFHVFFHLPAVTLADPDLSNYFIQSHCVFNTKFNASFRVFPDSRAYASPALHSAIQRGGCRHRPLACAMPCGGAIVRMLPTTPVFGVHLQVHKIVMRFACKNATCFIHGGRPRMALRSSRAGFFYVYHFGHVCCGAPLPPLPPLAHVVRVYNVVLVVGANTAKNPIPHGIHGHLNSRPRWLPLGITLRDSISNPTPRSTSYRCAGFRTRTSVPKCDEIAVPAHMLPLRLQHSPLPRHFLGTHLPR